MSKSKDFAIRTALVTLFVAFVSGIPAVVANGVAGTDTSSVCKGQSRHAEKIAKELFAKHRSKSQLEDYEITREIRDHEIVIRFDRKKTIKLGDHPAVIFDCRTKRTRYLEGE